MGTPLRVLIVEDSEDDALLITQALRRGGYKPTVVRVQTALEMRQALEQDAWDVVLSDYALPHFSGPQALALLHESGLDLPFIMISGTIGEEAAVTALKAGAHDFMSKGQLARLAPAIQRELREAESRRERRRAEAALREAEARYRILVEQLPAIAYLATLDATRTLYVSPQIEKLGYTPAEYQARPEMWLQIIHPGDRERVLAELADLRTTGRPFRTEYRVFDCSGQEVWLRDEAVVVNDEAGQPAFLQGVMLDITDRKRAEAQIQRQLERLAALRTIDQAISGSLDLRVTLSVFLQQVLSQLGVHAADILLVDHATQQLRYTAGQGLRTAQFQKAPQRVGEGRAGQAALERRIIHVADLRGSQPTSRRTGRLMDEGVVSYFAVPLTSKGQVVGVLELFHRAELRPDPDWLDFLEALAGQAAIAVENATLFSGLQRSNTELSSAYDATIEGWSRALDLRDRETKGHSQRVTQQTLALAQAMGVASAELRHMRWGALLHDIGKMGVPDAILLKPGPLTDEEWAVMRQHPVYAYQFLSPIHFLRPALEIPYCHHEKWDGTGYPRGLKGEQIPFAARIFAVVDVWDALRSDRPYRSAWPESRVREHLREQAGKSFDPRVVQAFLRLNAA